MEQLHPEYAPGQFEVSVAAESPVPRRTPRCSCARRSGRSGCGTGSGRRSRRRSTGRASATAATCTSARGGTARTSWPVAPTPAYGMTPDGESFAGGVLAHLPALLALGAPSVASYLRLVPQHWAGAYACWGLENREAALRLVTGSPGSERGREPRGQVRRPAREPVPPAGRRPRRSGAAATPLPEPVDVDPAVLGDDELGARGWSGCRRRCGSRSTPSRPDAVGSAFGEPLVGLDRRRAGVRAGALRRPVRRVGRGRDALAALTAGDPGT